MSDSDIEQQRQQSKKRKMEWVTSYSSMTMTEAQKRLGFRLQSLEEVPVDKMLADARKENPEAVWNLDGVKDEVYKGILRYMQIAGSSSMQMDPDYKQSTINYLVYTVISPIIEYFKQKTERQSVWLKSKKELVSPDNQTGGEVEFVVEDLAELESEDFMLIVETKQPNLGLGIKQCVLAMKDMHGNNGSGLVYGFATTGKSWQMLKYDGNSFQLSEEMMILFSRMGTERRRWISNLVDCICVALRNGGKKQPRTPPKAEKAAPKVEVRPEGKFLIGLKFRKPSRSFMFD